MTIKHNPQRAKPQRHRILNKKPARHPARPSEKVKTGMANFIISGVAMPND